MMANEELLKLLKSGVDNWNKWREGLTTLLPDLSESDLRKADLAGANLSGAILTGSDLSESNLSESNLSFASLVETNLNKADISRSYCEETNFSQADLTYADLRQADIRRAKLLGTNLSHANLDGVYMHGAELFEAKLCDTTIKGANLETVELSLANLDRSDLSHTNLYQANLSHASLVGAILKGATLRKTNFEMADLTNADLRNTDFAASNLNLANLTNANLTDSVLRQSSLISADISNAIISKCKVYGINVWDLQGEFKDQKELVITQEATPTITVDNIKVAQFIHLLLKNQEIREVINTLTSKTVLILGRFSVPERKNILDALRDKLRDYDLLPIVFDFDRPTDKDFTETIKTLAGISYFVIADVTNPKSSPLELQATVPDYQIPFVPIIQEGENPFAMMVDLQKKYPWVLPTRSYDSIETLMSALKPGIIDPAVEMRNKLRLAKAQEQVTENLKDYLGKTL
jgi:uncharacterized protein YjbI with pentapeptide repeats